MFLAKRQLQPILLVFPQTDSKKDFGEINYELVREHLTEAVRYCFFKLKRYLFFTSIDKN
jgi:hypothetical protein